MDTSKARDPLKAAPMSAISASLWQHLSDHDAERDFGKEIDALGKQLAALAMNIQMVAQCDNALKAKVDALSKPDFDGLEQRVENLEDRTDPEIIAAAIRTLQSDEGLSTSACRVCGAVLTEVRPGKFQCDTCEAKSAEQEQIPCPNCKGRGVTYESTNNYGTSATCPECHGSGSVPKPAPDFGEEVEQLRVQLATCGVAALGYTDGIYSVKQGVYGWSPSYQDVLTLRRKYEELAKAPKEAKPAPDGRDEVEDRTTASILGAIDNLGNMVGNVDNHLGELAVALGHRGIPDEPVLSSSVKPAPDLEKENADLRAQAEKQELTIARFRVQVADFEAWRPIHEGALDEVTEERDELKARWMDWENKEGSVCPEDVGFVEYIGYLKAQNEKMRRRVSDRGQEIANLNQMLRDAETIKEEEIGLRVDAEDKVRDLKAQLEKAEEIIRGLLLSADCSWEEHHEGHDWPEACQAARQFLTAALSPAQEPKAEKARRMQANPAVKHIARAIHGEREHNWCPQCDDAPKCIPILQPDLSALADKALAKVTAHAPYSGQRFDILRAKEEATVARAANLAALKDKMVEQVAALPLDALPQLALERLILDARGLLAAAKEKSDA